MLRKMTFILHNIWLTHTRYQRRIYPSNIFFNIIGDFVGRRDLKAVFLYLNELPYQAKKFDNPDLT